MSVQKKRIKRGILLQKMIRAWYKVLTKRMQKMPSLIKGQTWIGPRPIMTRKFLGKIEDFANKEEQQREKKHLKAYLKGKTEFQDGWEGVFPTRLPKMFPVQQELRELVVD